MKVYVDETGRIWSVDKPVDGLTELFINDDENPFAKWSTYLICCYKVQVVDGHVVMMTPAVDSRLLETFEIFGRETDDNTSGVAGVEDAVCELSETTDDAIAALEQAICELSEEIGR